MLTGLPLSGSNRYQVLLAISTPAIDLVIKGPPGHQVVEDFNLHRDSEGEMLKSSLVVTGDKISVAAFDPTSENMLSSIKEPFVYPCFFEQTNYEFIIKKKSDKVGTLSVDHQNKKIRDSLGLVGADQDIISGIINFEDQVGFSKFTILGDGEELLNFEIEVFPAKLDYRRDFSRILQEVNEEVYNLAFNFLMKTSFPATLYRDDKSSPSGAEFYYILSAIFDRFKKALELVKRNPHHKIVSENRVVAPEKVKKTDAGTVRWLSSKPHLLQKPGPGQSPGPIGATGYLPRRLIEKKKFVTYDTFENRYLKWMLHRVRKMLLKFKGAYEDGKNKAFDERVVAKVEEMDRFLDSYSRCGYLQEVGRLNRIDNYSLVIQLAPGYKDVYRYYLMLQKGLQIRSGLFELSIKKLSELYEYWCFLKISRLLRDKYRLVKNGLVSTGDKGITVDLVKGKESELVFYDDKNKEHITLVYNRFYINLPTLSQKPDNVLLLEKKGSNTRYHYILDAKYRISGDPEYIHSYNQAGPPEETINAMHRYRDAIVARQKSEGCTVRDYSRNVFGAFVLFPHNDELKYAGQKDGHACKFYDSIEEIGIGALPFLPGQTGLVDKFLQELVMESSKSAIERTLVPVAISGYLNEPGDERNVLIGPFRHKDQLQVCLNYEMYYTYLDRVKNYLGRLEYVALYQSKTLFSEDSRQGIFYYGKIKDFYIIKRGKITEMPASEKDWDKLAVKFVIDRWQKKSPHIRAGGYGPRRPLTTTLELLMEADYYPELHLKPVEHRLWRELKRFEENSRLYFKNESINEGESFNSMEFPGLIISNYLWGKVPGAAKKEEGFVIETEKGKKVFTYHALSTRPAKTVREIIEFWKQGG